MEREERGLMEERASSFLSIGARLRSISFDSQCVHKVVDQVGHVVHEFEEVVEEVEHEIENRILDILDPEDVEMEDNEDEEDAIEEGLGLLPSPSGRRRFSFNVDPRQKKNKKIPGCTLLVVSFCTVFLSQNALAPTLSMVADDLGFNEQERDTYLGAYLALALGVCSVPAAAALGAAADRRPRGALLRGCLLLGAAACLWGAAARGYAGLFLARVAAGASQGGALPVAYSLLGDLAPPERRGAVSAALTAAMGAGVLWGQLLVGAAAPVVGWRAPAGALALPMLAAAWAVGRWGREPPRGAAEPGLAGLRARGGGAAYAPPAPGPRQLWRTLCRPSNAILVLQGLPGSVPWGVICVFLNDFLAQEKGLSVQQATLVVGLFGLGAAVGSVAGGVLGQRVQRKSVLYLSLMMGLSMIFGTLPLMFTINADFEVTSFFLVSLSTVLSGFLASMNGANIRALLLNVNVPEARGAVMSVANLVANAGRGVGPLVATGLARWGARLRPPAAPDGGGGGGGGGGEGGGGGGGGGADRAWALSASLGGWVVAGALLLALAVCLEDDLAAAAQALARAAAEGEGGAAAARSHPAGLGPGEEAGAGEGRVGAVEGAPPAPATAPRAAAPGGRRKAREEGGGAGGGGWGGWQPVGSVGRRRRWLGGGGRRIGGWKEKEGQKDDVGQQIELVLGRTEAEMDVL